MIYFLANLEAEDIFGKTFDCDQIVSHPSRLPHLRLSACELYKCMNSACVGAL